MIQDFDFEALIDSCFQGPVACDFLVGRVLQKEVHDLRF